MSAGSAERVFEAFQRLRDDPGTAQERFHNYCANVLTSVERIHFDYKSKRDPQTPELGDDDKHNLAEAISGFANSGGGVILWGVIQKDETSVLKLQPLAQIQTFLSRLQQLGGQSTDPPAPGLDGAWIPASDYPGAGFAALLVPESPLPPHRVALKIGKIQHNYYVRSGSSFSVATHAQLEDMFGRRPQPKLVVAVRDEFPYDRSYKSWQINFDVVNEGRGTAKRVCVEFPSRDGVSAAAGIDNWRNVGGTCDPETGKPTSLFELLPQRVIHPGMAIRFDSVVRVGPPEFRPGESVNLQCTLYCEGCAPVRVSFEGSLEPVRDNRGS